uniref:(northern house mosquito) hypothetical protein n=1 Tax=Culex pipiens TaxID=7175 RepID=A0A8D8DJD6_CULPI
MIKLLHQSLLFTITRSTAIILVIILFQIVTLHSVFIVLLLLTSFRTFGTVIRWQRLEELIVHVALIFKLKECFQRHNAFEAQGRVGFRIGVDAQLDQRQQVGHILLISAEHGHFARRFRQAQTAKRRQTFRHFGFFFSPPEQKHTKISLARKHHLLPRAVRHE